MSLTNIYAPAAYSTDGTTVTFAFGFPFFADTDILVIYYDPVTLIPVVFTLNGGGSTGYTITPGTQDQDTGMYANGSIVLNVAPAAGKRITIDRFTAPTQETELNPVGPLLIADIEAGLDRLTMIVQELQVVASRCIQAPLQDVTPDMDLPPAEARAEGGPGPQVLVFDSSGNVALNNGLVGPAGPPGPGGTISSGPMETWLQSLPTAPAGTPAWWNNSGVPNFS